jgi:hypothetical protein
MPSTARQTQSFGWVTFDRAQAVVGLAQLDYSFASAAADGCDLEPRRGLLDDRRREPVVANEIVMRRLNRRLP